VIHAGQRPDPETGAVMPPVYLTSTYRRPSPDEDWPYGYARTINPTRSALERNLAALEQGIAAHCFASGMSAIAAALDLLEAGDHVIASANVYGGTYRLFDGLLRKKGLEFSWVDTSEPKRITEALRPTSRMLYVETPTNPTMKLTDIKAAARIAGRHGLRLVLDNTFMTPCFQQPLALGADIVVHSTTKYLNGHSDSIGGCVVTRHEADAERIGWLQKSVGAILSPMDSFLVLRGIKTLALRMERHDANGRKVAAWFDRRPAVRAVHYPGLANHPQHRLARRQAGGFGGMLSIDLGTRARARRFLRRLKLAALAESLGGVETLVAYPAEMTHGFMSPAKRRGLGVTDGLVRISVGIEQAEDLLADFEQALG
jgi:cystathionine gamma-lyase/cystathionine beta-lyase/cystathionine gamma-lyase/homocysteine desulfhydrase